MIDDPYKEASSASSAPRQIRVIILRLNRRLWAKMAPQVSLARPVRAGM